MTDRFVFPRPLADGDTIAICSPASIIRPEYVDGAVRALTEQGWHVRVMPHTLGAVGTYSGTCADRYADLAAALTDPSVRAVLCSRGGYGAAQLLDRLDKLPLRDDPKWLIGFSDISALHALMYRHGIVSLHASMAKQLTLFPTESAANAMLFGTLRGQRQPLNWASHPYNHPGTATGRLVGGNLAVLQALMRTPFDIFTPDTLLYIEDIAEPIYKVERILYQLRMAGVLDRLAGLIVGRFTEYRPDANYDTMEAMVRDMTTHLTIPIAFDAPIGHIEAANLPVLNGALATLTTTPTHSSITYA